MYIITNLTNRGYYTIVGELTQYKSHTSLGGKYEESGSNIITTYYNFI